MRIKVLIGAFMLALSASSAIAEEKIHDAGKGHGSDIFHMFRLEAGYGGGKDGAVANWELDGWIGTDENKLWLKSEGKRIDGSLEDAEVWALYSRNVSTFWDVQAGIRHDVQPVSTTYAAVGVNGLAPYFLETEAHFFISEEGDVSARLHWEKDLLLTQKLILQPYAGINLYAQDVPENDIGAGISSGEAGFQTRYEITRKFAPYVDIHYGRKFGETSSIAKNSGGDSDGFTVSAGLRLMF